MRNEKFTKLKFCKITIERKFGFNANITTFKSIMIKIICNVDIAKLNDYAECKILMSKLVAMRTAKV